MDDSANWFRARHARVMKATNELVDSTSTRTDERIAALRRISSELDEHDHLQEHLLALLSGVPGEDEIVARCRAEQAETRRRLETLGSSDPSAREFQRQADALYAQLEQRIRVEERELLHRIVDGTIGDDQVQLIIEAHAGPYAPHPTERRGPEPARR